MPPNTGLGVACDMAEKFLAGEPGVAVVREAARLCGNPELTPGATPQFLRRLAFSIPSSYEMKKK